MNDPACKSFRQEQGQGRRRCSAKEISDEAGVCSRSCGNHYLDIPGRFPCSEFRRVIGRIVVWQQQRQRRRLAERRRRRCRLAKYQRHASRARCSRRAEQCRRGSKRPGELCQACVSAHARHEHCGHRTIVRQRRQHRQRRNDRFGKVARIGDDRHRTADERRRRGQQGEQGGRSQDQEYLSRLLISILPGFRSTGSAKIPQANAQKSF